MDRGRSARGAFHGFPRDQRTMTIRTTRRTQTTKENTMRKTIVTVIAAATLSAALTACGSVGRTDAPEAPEQTVTAPPAPAEVEPVEEETDMFGYADATAEVTLKGCFIADLYDIGERDLTMDVAVKADKANTEKMHYSYQVEVLDPKGDRIAVLWGTASDVRPGQVVDTGKGDGEEDAFEDAAGVKGKFTCALISAEKDPSSNYS